ncbi:hypothetical protein TNCV_1750911 [Trichonephila clavipes]|nr:hypothetical protein TNCV_1750911 [Trichonephila clavipes]
MFQRSLTSLGNGTRNVPASHIERGLSLKVERPGLRGSFQISGLKESGLQNNRLFGRSGVWTNDTIYYSGIIVGCSYGTFARFRKEWAFGVIGHVSVYMAVNAICFFDSFDNAVACQVCLSALQAAWCEVAIFSGVVEFVARVALGYPFAIVAFNSDC